jgi:hypothetical protein
MAKKITLTDEEQELFNAIEGYVKLLREFYNKDSLAQEQDRQKVESVYGNMAEKAHELHMLLKDDGHEPKHHKYMIKNRGVPVEDVKFYRHLHPVEDLIKFISDPDANNDPEDTTIGVEFKIEIYTRRWGHYDIYALLRTKDGWELSAGSAFQDLKDDKRCECIKKILEHDNVSYPYNISDFFKWIWDQAADGADKDSVQKALNDISEWISICEKTVPRGMFEELI